MRRPRVRAARVATRSEARGPLWTAAADRVRTALVIWTSTAVLTCWPGASSGARVRSDMSGRAGRSRPVSRTRPVAQGPLQLPRVDGQQRWPGRRRCATGRGSTSTTRSRTVGGAPARRPARRRCSCRSWCGSTGAAGVRPRWTAPARPGRGPAVVRRARSAAARPRARLATLLSSSRTSRSACPWGRSASSSRAGCGVRDAVSDDRVRHRAEQRPAAGVPRRPVSTTPSRHNAPHRRRSTPPRAGGSATVKAPARCGPVCRSACRVACSSGAASGSTLES